MGIEQEIAREARRQILRHEARARLISEENTRRDRRSIDPGPLLVVSRPHAWTLDAGFNPYLVRARKARIAPSIQAKFEAREYRPRPPLLRSISKPGGGERTVSEYQVADSAVSKMLFERLLKKNAPLLSARAYAYRKDVSAQDAIQYVRSEFRGRSRLFIAEYDFQKYFDMVSHENIERTLTDHFLTTAIERHAIAAFLTTEGARAGDYSTSTRKHKQRGIPQGTSISLFLANVAAWNLDRMLERLGVSFTRYADDTLIWSSDYHRICEAADLLHEEAKTIGVSINSEKSPGIRLLVPDGASAEIEGTTSVDYLGYNVSLSEVQVKTFGKQRIQKRLAELIYWSLVREPGNETQKLERIRSEVDRDYVSLIWRIRRYLYGDLSEKAVRRSQRGEIQLRRFKGVMSAYPLIDDTGDLKALDTWLLDSIHLALRKRARLLRSSNISISLPPPHGFSREELRDFSYESQRTGEVVDLSVPCIRLIATVIRRAAAQHGASAIGRPDPYRY